MPSVYKKSPFAPACFPDLPNVAGVKVNSAVLGLRYPEKLDCMIAYITPGASVAGIYTQSRTRSAPVDWCAKRTAAQDNAPRRKPMALLANSGNANAFTGASGYAAVCACAQQLAAKIDSDTDNVFVASTGVIGELLPEQKIVDGIDQLVGGLPGDKHSSGNWENAAKAIMTTDTYPKGAGLTVCIDKQQVHFAGIAKGSGMISPNLATMLAFIFTDIDIAHDVLQDLLIDVAEDSFNAITVDGDCSTSDTVLIFASGKAKITPIESLSDPRLPAVREALENIARDLAQQIVKDGEGASKFFEIEITGAESRQAARRVAMAVANSPLVKTAIAGEDPNWGRIIMAVGKAGESVKRDLLCIRLGDMEICRNGAVAEDYQEDLAALYMKNPTLKISVDLGVGNERSFAWSCDLTKDYIAINSDYRS